MNPHARNEAAFERAEKAFLEAYSKMCEAGVDQAQIADYIARDLGTLTRRACDLHGWLNRIQNHPARGDQP